MKKHEVVNNIKIYKLIFGGKWLGLAPDGKKIIISGWVIPGSIINLRILKERKNYYEGQMLDEVKKSPLEQKLPDHFQVYGGCKWLPIDHNEQLRIKEEQVSEAFYHLRDYTTETNFHPIVASPEIYGYRNKVEFSWWKYISARENIHDEFRFWFHKQGEFDRIINCSFCVLADEETNAIFKDVDKFSRESGITTYDPKTQIGFWRHLVVRKAKYTSEIMLIYSVNDDYLRWWVIAEFKKEFLQFIELLTNKYSNIKSVYYLKNNGKADIVTWEFNLVYWSKTITEKLLWKSFEINPKSFFQTNSLGAEKLYSEVLDLISLTPNPSPHSGEGDQHSWVDSIINNSTFLWNVALDLYAGTGTIGILLADRFNKVYSVELVKEASLDWERNAKLNNCNNIEFINAKVEEFLANFITPGFSGTPGLNKVDLLVIDPPRDGMHPDALTSIISFNSKTIIYVSCNPSTLARDLDFIVKNSEYKIKDVIPVDMFPHTHHIETVVRLEK